MRNLLLICILAVGMSATSYGQFNIGIVSGFDIYQRTVNPKNDTPFKRSSGSAILNFSFGPKLWVGGEKFSVSAESYASWGILALNAQEVYGLGALQIPILAKLNFNGLSGFSKKFKSGFSIGGGLQYNRTELYGVSSIYRNQGLERNWFRTYAVELAAGLGFKSFTADFYVRYTNGLDLSGHSISIGINSSRSFIKQKKSKAEQENLLKDEGDEMDRIFNM